MASTFLGLTISYTGLQAAQTSINTTSHNISNINTEGYTRQKVNTQADNALLTHAKYGAIGTGVVVTGIQQLRDSYYDEKYRDNRKNFGEYEAKQNYMSQIENYLNEFQLKGFTSAYSSFFTAAAELQKKPTDSSVQNSFVNTAYSMAQYFNTLSTNLTNVQKDANEEIKNQVNKINTIGENIAALNKQINQVEASNGTANDLRDKRNVLIDQLSAIVNVQKSESDMGNGLTDVTIKINGQILVDSYSANKLIAEPKKDKANFSDADGLYNLRWESGLEFDEYSTTLSGTIKGLIDIRDGNNGSLETQVIDADGNKTLQLSNNSDEKTNYKGIPYYVSKLNEFIKIFTSSVNDIFTSGKTLAGDAGIPLFTNQYENAPMSALTVTVNSELLKAPSKLATTTKPSEGADYRDVIDNLVNFQKSKVFESGTGEYYLESIVSEESIDSGKAKTFLANYTNISNTVANQRLSVMGVDENEEGLDTMKFQEAYNLSSKMFSVMNQIYDKLINQTGV